MPFAFFAIDEAALAALKKRDRKLSLLIDLVQERRGSLQRPVIPDIFCALCHSIVGQQISSKVHATLWQRFGEQLAPLTPAHLAGLETQDFRACGLSERKAGYIQGIARDIVEGRFDPGALQAMDDAAVCETLCRLKGVGQWSAEMLLIFCLQRPDVLSFGDFGIQRGLRMLYGHKEITPELFARYRKRYSPHATLASLYLWELASGDLPGYTDPQKEPKKGPGKAPQKGTQKAKKPGKQAENKQARMPAETPTG